MSLSAALDAVEDLPADLAAAVRERRGRGEGACGPAAPAAECVVGVHAARPAGARVCRSAWTHTRTHVPATRPREEGSQTHTFSFFSPPPHQLAPARARLDADSWDASAWDDALTVVDAVCAGGRVAVPPTVASTRLAVLDAFAARFPSSPDAWRRGAAARAGDADALKALYARCLLSVPDAALWRGYVSFVVDGNAPRGGEGATESRAAFEYALRAVGTDARASPLWQDYISYLSRPLPGSPLFVALFGAAPGQEASARAAALRSAYQRALAVPSPALEGLWRAYEGFEGGVADRALGKRALDEWRPRVAAAKTAWRERERLTAPLISGPASTVLPLPPGRGGPAQAAAAAAWRSLIAWEASNPQSLDPPALAARVGLAHAQCLIQLAHYPHAWLDAAAWHAGPGGDAAAARALLARGRTILPSSPLLLLASADLEEDAGEDDAAKTLYEGAVGGLAPDGEGAGGAGPSPSATPASAEGGDATADAAATPPTTPFSPADATLIWTHYMQFERRRAGGGLRAARRVFMRARKAKTTTWHAFAAAAALEWDADPSPTVPRNIFELGMRRFSTDAQFVLRYAGWLRSVGDSANARALFERALAAGGEAAASTDADPATTLSLDGEASLWDGYIALERQVGGPGAARGVATRRAAALASRAGTAGGVPRPPRPGDALRSALERYCVEGLWPVSEDAKTAAEVAAGLREEESVGAPATAPPHRAATTTAPTLPPRRSPPPRAGPSPPHGGLPPPARIGGGGPPRPPLRPHPAGPPPAVAALLADLPPREAVLAEGGPLPDVDRLLDVLLAAGPPHKRGAEGPPPGGDRVRRARVGYE